MVGAMPNPVVLELGITDQHVCNECRGNRYHVNVVWFASNQYFDVENIWCSDCDDFTDVVLPSEMEDE